MPIRVNLPDGSVANFPDGTAPAEIEAALSSFSKKETPAPDFATAGQIAPSTPKSLPATPHLIDLLGPEAERKASAKADMAAMIKQLPAAVGPGGDMVTNGVTSTPGIIARTLGISKERAVQNMQGALNAAGNAPIDVSKVQPLLDATQADAKLLGSRKAVGGLADMISNGPIAAPAGHKAASAFGELTTVQSVKPTMRRDFGMLSKALRAATAEATDSAATYNLGANAEPGQYMSGVDEFRRAMLARKWAQRIGGAAAAAGALDWLRGTRVGRAVESMVP